MNKNKNNHIIKKHSRSDIKFPQYITREFAKLIAPEGSGDEILCIQTGTVKTTV